MPTPTTWTDSYNRSFLNIDDNTYNRKIILDREGLDKLVTYLEVGQFPDSLVIDATEWISGITYFPINIPYSQKRWLMKIGLFSTNIPCSAFFTPVQYFILVGTASITPKFYNFADYNGYTKIQCWLPYYGMVELLPNDVMGKQVEFWLSIDYSTGSALYYVCVKDERDTANGYARIILTVNFQLGYPIPLGSANMVEMVRNLSINAVKTVGQAIITAVAVQTGGTGGAMVATSGSTSTTTTTHQYNSTFAGHNIKGYNTKDTGSTVLSGSENRTYDNTRFLQKQLADDVFNNSVSALQAMHISASSDKPNNINLLRNGSRSIKIVIYRPIMQDVISDYAHLVGKPLGQVRTLGELTGYTEIAYIHTEGEDFATATAEEMSMLNAELLGGILL